MKVPHRVKMSNRITKVISSLYFKLSCDTNNSIVVVSDPEAAIQPHYFHGEGKVKVFTKFESCS